MGRGHWRRSVSPTHRSRALRDAGASGFTLIELLIVVAIVAILAAIAVPSYRRYVMHGNREAAESLMLEIASAQERYMVDNRGYAADVGTLGYGPSAQPTGVSSNYDLAVATSSGLPPTYSITATPKTGSPQANDSCGKLTLGADGNKQPTGCWK
ncbi:type IV pilin protein [Dyella sp. EPa41]|uniref:type IV pilin protein n=1 Tax=Dyella sp. EPa41 TaxID=1561194 RepID=UPI001915A4D7|nr:type IV pilin protein [Dyella sp. EPa41]